MKTPPSIKVIVCLIAILTLVAGCVTSNPATERLLTAAGFKTTMATTPEQKEHLKTLPNGRVSMASLNGQTYYVYPDTKENLLYVGKIIQYRVYQGMRVNNDMSAESREPVALTYEQNAGWGIWGSMGPRGMW